MYLGKGMHRQFHLFTAKILFSNLRFPFQKCGKGEAPLIMQIKEATQRAIFANLLLYSLHFTKVSFNASF